MRLSQVAGPAQVVVERDAEFQSLGFVSSTLPALLVYLGDARFLREALGNDSVAAVIASPALAPEIPAHLGLAVAEAPMQAFYAVHHHLATRTAFYWQDFETEIDATARVHPAAYVAPRNVRIGPGTVVEPGARVLERSIVGAEVVLRAGCVVGSEGFEFKRIGGQVRPVVHAGGARLGDRVEVQANSAISRAVFGGFTSLGDDTKLDNLVHVAHGVTIGTRCLLAASAMIAGSVVMGDDVWVGPGSSISSGVRIGDGASITIGSVVTRDVAAGERVTGNFAIPHSRFLAFLRTIR
jgi:UDP-3-O-[3-hydroxymyristoyl] glucosamine N-acyltransferase